MSYYQEIVFFSDEEVGINFVLSKVFIKLHLAFVEKKKPDNTSNYAIGFPQYNLESKNLGTILRVFSSKEKLEELQLEALLESFSDYLKISLIMVVPDTKNGIVSFKRRQEKTDSMRLARRLSKRKNISLENAVFTYQNFTPKKIELPFIDVKSFSTKQSFKIFISMERKELITEPVFNQYGLAITGGIPDF